jgi:hypothetical protein
MDEKYDFTKTCEYLKTLTKEERLIFVKGMQYASAVDTALRNMSDKQLYEYEKSVREASMNDENIRYLWTDKMEDEFKKMEKYITEKYSPKVGFFANLFKKKVKV